MTAMSLPFLSKHHSTGITCREGGRRGHSGSAAAEIETVTC